MEKKFISSIKISHEINTKMLHSIVEKNANLKGKSKWIIQAIEEFLCLEDYPDLVDIATEMKDLSVTVSFRLPEDILAKLEAAIITVRKKYPSIEGVKSNIIRASIIQKLIR